MQRFGARVKQVVAAVTAGRYREWVRLDPADLRSDPEAAKKSRLLARGYLQLNHETLRISHNVLIGFALEARGFEYLRYEPY